MDHFAANCGEHQSKWRDKIKFRIMHTNSSDLLKENQKLHSELEELRKENALLSRIANNVNSILFLFEVVDNQYKFVFINQHFFKDTGYSESDFLGKYMHEVTPTESYKRLVAKYEIALQNNELITWSEPSPYNDGFKHGLISIEPFQENNKQYLLGQTTDITENIQDKEKLRLSNETKDKLFSIISHDLKNPFNTIKGFSEILRKKLDTDREAAFNAVNIINQVSRMGTYMIDNLLNWSLTQQGKFKLSLQEISLTEVINEAIQMAVFQADLKHITITKVINPNGSIIADKNIIKTIIRNFLVNAIKFSKEHSQIIVEATANKKKIIFKVIDEGKGIDKKLQKNLFSVHSHKSELGTANEPGTGVGLLLCHDLIKIHKGKIGVESEAGKGATFWFEIDYVSPQNSQSHP